MSTEYYGGFQESYLEVVKPSGAACAKRSLLYSPLHYH